MGHARVVNEYVESAKVAADLIHHSANFIAALHIRLNSDRLGTSAVDFIRKLLRRFGGLAIVYRAPADTSPSQLRNYSRPDAASAARHQRHSAGKFHRFVPVLSIVYSLEL